MKPIFTKAETEYLSENINKAKMVMVGLGADHKGLWDDNTTYSDLLILGIKDLLNIRGKYEDADELRDLLTDLLETTEYGKKMRSRIKAVWDMFKEDDVEHFCDYISIEVKHLVSLEIEHLASVKLKKEQNDC